jgi:hypothetical protein
MKQRLAIAGLTIVVLGAGYLTGAYTERTRCKVPPAPPSLLGELSGRPTPAQPSTTVAPTPNPAALAAKIEELRPQIEEFRRKMDEIDEEMDRQIDGILRPEQKELFKDLVNRGVVAREQEKALVGVAGPLTPEEIRELQQRPLQRLFSIIVIGMRVDWNTRQLKLDPEQTKQLESFLKARREKFIALVDKSPPPSLTLSKLAPLAQRLVETPKR